LRGLFGADSSIQHGTNSENPKKKAISAAFLN
jgi:hypothetical protein